MRIEMRRLCASMVVFYGVYMITTVQLYNWIDDDEAIFLEAPSLTNFSGDETHAPLHLPKRSHHTIRHHKLKGKELLRQYATPVNVQDDDPDGDHSGSHSRHSRKPMPDPDPISNHKHAYRERDFPKRPESPYETKHAGQKLPDWAEKPFFLRHEVSQDKSLCFVHVGKTAGSTLACHLGFKYECGGQLRIPEGYLTEHTTHLIHNNFNDCHDDHGYYLFATRHPLKRMQSWFTYERPPPNHSNGPLFQKKKPLFIDCPFPTLNDLAEQGLRRNGTASDVCQHRARAAILGTELHMRHNYYNYGYYLGQTPDNATVVVIRSEHMDTDWNAIEVDVLGGEAPHDFTFKQANPSTKADQDKYLSDEAQELLCEYLCHEIQTYKEILQRAMNLNATQVEESLVELEQTCPLQTRQFDCPKVSELLEQ